MTTGHCRPTPAKPQPHLQLQQHQQQPPQHQHQNHQQRADTDLMRVLAGRQQREHHQQAAAAHTTGMLRDAQDARAPDRFPRRSPEGGSLKSAKRKAAEALLAAQYAGLRAAPLGPSCCSSSGGAGGSSSSTRLMATAAAVDAAGAGGGSSGGCAADGGAAPTLHHHVNKKQNISVASAISRLGGTPRPSPAAAAAGRTTVGLSTQQQPALPPPQKQNQQLQGVVAGSSSSPAPPPAGAGEGLAAAAAAAAGAPSAKQCVQVPACGADCQHTFSHGWCHTKVRLPHIDWGSVMDANINAAPSFRVARGYERLVLPGGVQVLLVEEQAHLASALQLLRRSMLDDVIAIDLEWRPQFGKGFTPVAMVQLASSTMAVLVRTCRMGYKLPSVLNEFLKDTQVHLVGFSWALADEGKMQSTFGLGNRDFGRFTDLQLVAHGLGYHSFGLARLARQVLGMSMPKSKRVSMSNWEAAGLSRIQVKYAALDVLVAGQVFRALRLWHSSPSLCEVCHYSLGASSGGPGIACDEPGCGRGFGSIRQYLDHCERSGHAAQWAECEGCGCARALPWPSGRQPKQQQQEGGSGAGGSGEAAGRADGSYGSAAPSH